MQNLSRRPVRLHLCCQKWWGQDSSHSEGRHSRSETQNIFSLGPSKIFSITNRKSFTTFKLFAEILVATASFTRICFKNPGIFPKKTFRNIIQYSTVNMFTTFISNFLKSFYLEKLNLLLKCWMIRLTQNNSLLEESYPDLSSEAPKLDPNSILPEMKIIYILYWLRVNSQNWNC